MQIKNLNDDDDHYFRPGRISKRESRSNAIETKQKQQWLRAVVYIVYHVN